MLTCEPSAEIVYRHSVDIAEFYGPSRDFNKLAKLVSTLIMAWWTSVSMQPYKFDEFDHLFDVCGN
jgi:hypothetical protein